MVSVADAQDERELHTQCLLASSATRAENAALRQALRVNTISVGSLFSRLLEAERDYPWLADALRRSEQRCTELEAQMVNVGAELESLRHTHDRCAELERELAETRDELTRVYHTKTFRTLAPLRRVWSVFVGSGPSR